MRFLATAFNLLVLKLFFKKSSLRFINKNNDENEIQYEALKDTVPIIFRMTFYILLSSPLICNKIPFIYKRKHVEENEELHEYHNNGQ